MSIEGKQKFKFPRDRLAGANDLPKAKPVEINDQNQNYSCDYGEKLIEQQYHEGFLLNLQRNYRTVLCSEKVEDQQQKKSKYYSSELQVAERNQIFTQLPQNAQSSIGQKSEQSYHAQHKTADSSESSQYSRTLLSTKSSELEEDAKYDQEFIYSAEIQQQIDYGAEILCQFLRMNMLHSQEDFQKQLRTHNTESGQLILSQSGSTAGGQQWMPQRNFLQNQTQQESISTSSIKPTPKIFIEELLKDIQKDQAKYLENEDNNQNPLDVHNLTISKSLSEYLDYNSKLIESGTILLYRPAQDRQPTESGRKESDPYLIRQKFFWAIEDSLEQYFGGQLAAAQATGRGALQKQPNLVGGAAAENPRMQQSQLSLQDQEEWPNQQRIKISNFYDEVFDQAQDLFNFSEYLRENSFKDNIKTIPLRLQAFFYLQPRKKNIFTMLNLFLSYNQQRYQEPFNILFKIIEKDELFGKFFEEELLVYFLDCRGNQILDILISSIESYLQNTVTGQQKNLIYSYFKQVVNEFQVEQEHTKHILVDSYQNNQKVDPNKKQEKYQVQITRQHASKAKKRLSEGLLKLETEVKFQMNTENQAQQEETIKCIQELNRILCARSLLHELFKQKASVDRQGTQQQQVQPPADDSHEEVLSPHAFSIEFIKWRFRSVIRQEDPEKFKTKEELDKSNTNLDPESEFSAQPQQKKTDQREGARKKFKYNKDLIKMLNFGNEGLDRITDGDWTNMFSANFYDFGDLNGILNPALLQILYFYHCLLTNLRNTESEKYTNKNTLPRITFINLDGFDDGFFFPLIQEYRPIQYISIFEDKFGGSGGDDDQEANSVISSFPTEKDISSSRSYNLYVPANSDYLSKSYYGASCKRKPQKQMEKVYHYSSGKLFYLFRKYIVPLVRAFQGQVIVVSYNPAICASSVEEEGSQSYTFGTYNKTQPLLGLNQKRFEDILQMLFSECQCKVLFHPRFVLYQPSLSKYGEITSLYERSAQVNEKIQRHYHLLQHINSKYSLTGVQLNQKFLEIRGMLQTALKVLTRQGPKSKENLFTDHLETDWYSIYEFAPVIAKVIKAVRKIYNPNLQILLMSTNSLQVQNLITRKRVEEYVSQLKQKTAENESVAKSASLASKVAGATAGNSATAGHKMLPEEHKKGSQQSADISNPNAMQEEGGKLRVKEIYSNHQEGKQKLILGQKNKKILKKISSRALNDFLYIPNFDEQNSGLPEQLVRLQLQFNKEPLYIDNETQYYVDRDLRYLVLFNQQGQGQEFRNFLFRINDLQKQGYILQGEQLPPMFEKSEKSGVPEITLLDFSMVAGNGILMLFFGRYVNRITSSEIGFNEEFSPHVYRIELKTIREPKKFLCQRVQILNSCQGDFQQNKAISGRDMIDEQTEISEYQQHRKKYIDDHEQLLPRLYTSGTVVTHPGSQNHTEIFLVSGQEVRSSTKNNTILNDILLVRGVDSNDVLRANCIYFRTCHKAKYIIPHALFVCLSFTNRNEILLFGGTASRDLIAVSHQNISAYVITYQFSVRNSYQVQGKPEQQQQATTELMSDNYLDSIQAHKIEVGERLEREQFKNYMLATTSVNNYTYFQQQQQDRSAVSQPIQAQNQHNLVFLGIMQDFFKLKKLFYNQQRFNNLQDYISSENLALIKLAQFMPVRSASSDSQTATRGQTETIQEKSDQIDKYQGSTDKNQASTDKNQASTDKNQASTDKNQASTDKNQGTTTLNSKRSTNASTQQSTQDSRTKDKLSQDKSSTLAQGKQQMPPPVERQSRASEVQQKQGVQHPRSKSARERARAADEEIVPEEEEGNIIHISNNHKQKDLGKEASQTKSKKSQLNQDKKATDPIEIKSATPSDSASTVASLPPQVPQQYFPPKETGSFYQTLVLFAVTEPRLSSMEIEAENSTKSSQQQQANFPTDSQGTYGQLNVSIVSQDQQQTEQTRKPTYTLSDCFLFIKLLVDPSKGQGIIPSYKDYQYKSESQKTDLQCFRSEASIAVYAKTSKKIVKQIMIKQYDHILFKNLSLHNEQMAAKNKDSKNGKYIYGNLQEVSAAQSQYKEIKLFEDFTNKDSKNDQIEVKLSSRIFYPSVSESQVVDFVQRGQNYYTALVNQKQEQIDQSKQNQTKTVSTFKIGQKDHNQQQQGSVTVQFYSFSLNEKQIEDVTQIGNICLQQPAYVLQMLSYQPKTCSLYIDEEEGILIFGTRARRIAFCANHKLAPIEIYNKFLQNHKLNGGQRTYTPKTQAIDEPLVLKQKKLSRLQIKLGIQSPRQQVQMHQDTVRERHKPDQLETQVDTHLEQPLDEQLDTHKGEEHQRQLNDTEINLPHQAAASAQGQEKIQPEQETDISKKNNQVQGLRAEEIEIEEEEDRYLISQSNDDLSQNKFNCLAFSQDQKYLVIGLCSNLIKIWNRQDNCQYGTLFGHKKAINSVVFSNNSQYLASASSDSTFKIWDVQNKKELFTYDPSEEELYQQQQPLLQQQQLPLNAASINKAEIQCIAFSIDDKLLAWGSSDGQVKLKEFDHKSLVQQLSKHASAVSCIAFSPNTKYLASGSSDRTIRIWYMEENKDIELQIQQDILSVQFSNGYSLYSVTSNKTIQVWNVENKSQIEQKELTDQVRCLAFSPGCKYLASVDQNNKVKLFNTNQRDKQENDFEEVKSWIVAVTFTHDGNYLAAVCKDSTIYVWNTSNLRVFQTFKVNRPRGKSELSKQARKLTTLRYDISKDYDRNIIKEFADLFDNQPKFRQNQPFFLETLNLNKSIVDKNSNQDLEKREEEVYRHIFSIYFKGPRASQFAFLSRLYLQGVEINEEIENAIISSEALQLQELDLSWSRNFCSQFLERLIFSKKFSQLKKFSMMGVKAKQDNRVSGLKETFNKLLGQLDIQKLWRLQLTVLNLSFLDVQDRPNKKVLESFLQLSPNLKEVYAFGISHNQKSKTENQSAVNKVLDNRQGKIAEAQQKYANDLQNQGTGGLGQNLDYSKISLKGMHNSMTIDEVRKVIEKHKRLAEAQQKMEHLYIWLDDMTDGTQNDLWQTIENEMFSSTEESGQIQNCYTLIEKRVSVPQNWELLNKYQHIKIYPTYKELFRTLMQLQELYSSTSRFSPLQSQLENLSPVTAQFFNYKLVLPTDAFGFDARHVDMVQLQVRLKNFGDIHFQQMPHKFDTLQSSIDQVLPPYEERHLSIVHQRLKKNSGTKQYELEQKDPMLNPPQASSTTQPSPSAPAVLQNQPKPAQSATTAIVPVLFPPSAPQLSGQTTTITQINFGKIEPISPFAGLTRGLMFERATGKEEKLYVAFNSHLGPSVDPDAVRVNDGQLLVQTYNDKQQLLTKGIAITINIPSEDLRLATAMGRRFPQCMRKSFQPQLIAVAELDPNLAGSGVTTIAALPTQPQNTPLQHSARADRPQPAAPAAPTTTTTTATSSSLYAYPVFVIIVGLLLQKTTAKIYQFKLSLQKETLQICSNQDQGIVAELLNSEIIQIVPSANLQNIFKLPVRNYGSQQTQDPLYFATNLASKLSNFKSVQYATSNLATSTGNTTTINNSQPKTQQIESKNQANLTANQNNSLTLTGVAPRGPGNTASGSVSTKNLQELQGKKQ